MKLRILKSFRDKLNEQVEFIAIDKPRAARKFKDDVIRRIKNIPDMPFSHRKSIYFDRDDIRDLIFKGYTIVYKIDSKKNIIDVFGLVKFEKDPFGS